ncbi:MAG: Fe-S cluster assembly ATPase SufC [Deltaproteobacteria bacterium RIFCSPLOWO2_12_FULL_40_28]|nr:MAG: Fe-S cluster assembly ATPase SufC [Deltaproteobacteria bacterium RIFCSPHIGHO2_02_FULL_40_28]OGQ19296.1 MAG: Fe-S cluster assembly ATPase SufC [Deltaproteobacteria bacterium RIFCSPHIGHO2_12_FULL_40_32]OGQ40480.1 MAG: Fe-S cluster assembly ATPase SufC [Deltaproteobacteria bacterium RIFCSPLOWO2_02_FULL_40_36]OGQ53716.1 MAG: Fe-S cluster assembly ATPase SufC [Deltaproteobacteria bacterium RIFCSPLOWO2_12_FULL_40_28]
MLEIKNLSVSVDNKQILNGLNLSVKAGEVHAIMGPNGSGKSTLAHILAGKPGYEIIGGEIIYQGKNLLAMEPELRACEGIFLAFQYPVEISGVNNLYFLKEAYNAIRRHRAEKALDAMDFLKLAKEKMKLVELNESFFNRNVNEGFSGGEKKRNEIFQMAILDPTLAILDETDSGLDIDALKTVASGVNHLRNEKKAIILVTHYQRLLDYIKPDFVHVLAQGKIIKSGDATLALRLEEEGYSWALEKENARA